MYSKRDNDISVGVAADLYTARELKEAFNRAGVPFVKDKVQRFLNEAILDQLEDDLVDEDSEIANELLEMLD